MDLDCPAVAELVADVAAVVARQAAAVPEDVSKVILGEIPQLDDDEPLRALLCACIASSVETCLQVMQYRDPTWPTCGPRRWWGTRAAWRSAASR